MYKYELLFAGNLLDFADALSNSLREYGEKLAFYKNLNAEMEHLLYIYQVYNSSKEYCLYRHRFCNVIYLANRWNFKPSARENRAQLKGICKEIQEKIIPPQGMQVSEQFIEAVFSYLEEKYHFSKGLLESKPIDILLPAHTHRDYNGACITYGTDHGCRSVIELYHLRSGAERSPEFVLFHELGHVVQMQLTGHPAILPLQFKRVLEKSGAANAEHVDEIFADILAIEMMYGSPFEKYLPQDYRAIIR